MENWICYKYSVCTLLEGSSFSFVLEMIGSFLLLRFSFYSWCSSSLAYLWLLCYCLTQTKFSYTELALCNFITFRHTAFGCFIISLVLLKFMLLNQVQHSVFIDFPAHFHPLFLLYLLFIGVYGFCLHFFCI